MTLIFLSPLNNKTIKAYEHDLNERYTKDQRIKIICRCIKERTDEWMNE